MEDHSFNPNICKPFTLPLPSTDKSIIWLPDINKYILVSPPADIITEKIYCREHDQSILQYCTEELEIPVDDAKETIDLIKRNLAEIDKERKSQPDPLEEEITHFSGTFNCKRHYNINELVFCFEYETPEIEYLIHPKLAHLEIDAASGYNHHFQLYTLDSKVVLQVNGKPIGMWTADREHFMTGKVSMELLQKLYSNDEKDWMAVFHAAGISNGVKSIMFLGDSGSGKSTLAAILMANGYEVLADDFLPVESGTSQICAFPAAISVKKDALDLLTPVFPELQKSREYCYPRFNKTVRYLSRPETASGNPDKVPCKALVFVSYNPNTDLDFSHLSKDIAFQKLVPDSWISPLEKNAIQFMHWFNEMPCFQLTYSNNELMVKTVQKLFDHAI